MICLVRDYDDDALDVVAALCDARRRAYALHQPVFWRPAADAAEVGRAFLAEQVARETTIAAVHESDGVLDGFVLASIVDAPPVYDPGGRTCAIDDFAVADPALWAHVGPELLTYVTRQARERGAVQCVVVTTRRTPRRRRRWSPSAAAWRASGTCSTWRSWPPPNPQGIRRAFMKA